MKIAVYSDVFGGKMANGVVVSIIKLVKGLADKGHKIYLVVSKNEDNVKFRYKNVKIIEAPSIPAFFGKEDYLKVVGLNYEFMKKLTWVYQRFLFNRCDLVTCPSESTLKEILKNGIKGKRNIAISNGIDKNDFDNSKSGLIKKRYNLHGKTILFFGRVSLEKNILYLIDVFKMITDEIPGVKLMFVGDGPQLKEIKEKVEEIGIKDKVIFTGMIEHKKLMKSGIIGACDIFITASLTETQGLTTLESQVNGLVCVGTDATGTKDLIKDGYNGFLVKNGNKKEFAKKVVKLLTDEKLYSRMKTNTLKEVKKHYIKNIVNIWEKELKLLVKTKRLNKK